MIKNIALLLVLLAPQGLKEEDFKKAEAALAINPDDAAANLTAGKYLAFVKENWEKAIPYLAKGSDTNLKKLAEKEISDPKPAMERIGLGDEWIDAAKKLSAFRAPIQRHASSFYALAWPDLDGVWKDKLRDRAKRMLQAAVPGQARKGTPAGWKFDGQKISADPTVAHSGQCSIRLEGGKEKTAFGNTGFSNDLIVSPQGKLTISAWVATDGTESAKDKLIVGFFGTNGNFITHGSGAFIAPDFPFWQKIESTFEIPKEVVRINIGVLLYSQKGTLWVDDISLKNADGKEFVENGGFEK